MFQNVERRKTLSIHFKIKSYGKYRHVKCIAYGISVWVSIARSLGIRKLGFCGNAGINLIEGLCSSSLCFVKISLFVSLEFEIPFLIEEICVSEYLVLRRAFFAGVELLEKSKRQIPFFNKLLISIEFQRNIWMSKNESEAFFGLVSKGNQKSGAFWNKQWNRTVLKWNIEWKISRSRFFILKCFRFGVSF